MQSINSNNNIYGILLRNMQLNSKVSATSTERLSTGKRINHASDSPSDMLRISRLNSTIRGTEVAGRNIQDGVSLIQTTENSLNEVKNIGQRLKELSVSYNNGTLSDDDKKAIENESSELLKEIQNIQDKTTFNGQKVFSKDNYTIQTGSEANDTYNIKIKGVDVSKLGAVSINASQSSNTTSNNNVDNTTSGNNNSTNNTTNTSGTGASTTTTTSATGSTGATGTSGTSNTTTSTGTGTTSSGTTTSTSGQTTNTCSNTSTGSTTTTSSNTSSTTTSSTSNPLMTAVNVTNTTGYVEWKNSSGNLIYVGNVTNGKYDGYGTLYDGNGSKVYQGNFTNGAYNGYGTLYSGGKVSYVGSISNGVYNGFGTTYDSSGNVTYVGDFKNGKYDGYGTEKLSNGYTYAGYYTDGLKNGYGTLSNQNWLPLYAGNWTNDKPSDGRTISGYTPKTASDVKVVTYTPPATIIPSTSTGGNTSGSGTTTSPSTGTSGGSTTTPSTGTSGSTTPTSGTGTTGGSTTPSTGTGSTPTNGGSGTTPSGGSTTTPTGSTGNTGTGTGTGTATTPSTGTSGSGGTNTTPTGSTGSSDCNTDIINILKDGNVDKYILKPVSDAISSLGVQEEVLNYRYDLSVSQNDINKDHLSKIEDVDMASEMLKKAKADMLSQVNLSLFSNQLNDDKNYIAMLLR